MLQSQAPCPAPSPAMYSPRPSAGPTQHSHSSAAPPTAQLPDGQHSSRQAVEALPASAHPPAPGNTAAQARSMQADRFEAVRNLRHCSSLHSVADAAEGSHAQPGSVSAGHCAEAQRGSVKSSECGGPQHAYDAHQQMHQQAAESLNARHVEACVASSRRLEQPTASTGTSRPVPLVHVGQFQLNSVYALDVGWPTGKTVSFSSMLWASLPDCGCKACHSWNVMLRYANMAAKVLFWPHKLQ